MAYLKYGKKKAYKVGPKRYRVAKRGRKTTGRKRKSSMLKKVKRMIEGVKPTKKVNYALAPPIGLAHFQLTTLIANVFPRVTEGTSGAVAAVGGDVNASQGTWVGDTISGNKIRIVGMSLRGAFRNMVYSPHTYVRLYLVRTYYGNVPTVANMFMGLAKNSLLDRLCNDDVTVIAEKSFKLPIAEHTGNYYLPLSKPGGGTTSNAATGTYWDTPGVGILGNTNTTYDTENVVYFNANTMSGSFAPSYVPFIWNIPTTKLKHITWNEGVSVAATYGQTVQPSTVMKDWAYSLVAYTYVNDLVGANPILYAAQLVEATWEYRFKEGR